MGKSFDPTTDIPDLSGKVVLVTGGNIGIGRSTILALAAHNPTCIYLCARRQTSAEEAVALVHASYPKANIRILELDLASFDSVKACAATFNNEAERLDLLFLNAGVCGIAPGLTKEGYEVTFGINHLGHALLTQLLLPKMQQTLLQHPDTAAGNVRIILTSSYAAQLFYSSPALSLESMRTDAAEMKTMTRYGHSKLANILTARKLAQLYPSITSVAVHPGTVKSDIFRKADDTSAPWVTRQLFALAVRMTGTSCEEGAKTQLWAATAGQGVENGGFYFPGGKATVDKHVKDQGVVDELWNWTTEQLKAHGGPGWPEA